MIGLKQHYLKLSFCNQTDCLKVRKDILAVVRKNKRNEDPHAVYTEMLTNAYINKEGIDHGNLNVDHLENILDIR